MRVGAGIFTVGSSEVVVHEQPHTVPPAAGPASPWLEGGPFGTGLLGINPILLLIPHLSLSFPGVEEWASNRSKAPPARTAKGVYRDQPYSRY